MERALVTVQCNSCQNIIDRSGLITIDIMNGLSHQDCEGTGIPVKDEGTYEEIAVKYPYFYMQF